MLLAIGIQLGFCTEAALEHQLRHTNSDGKEEESSCFLFTHVSGWEQSFSRAVLAGYPMEVSRMDARYSTMHHRKSTNSCFFFCLLFLGGTLPKNKANKPLRWAELCLQMATQQTSNPYLRHRLLHLSSSIWHSGLQRRQNPVLQEGPCWKLQAVIPELQLLLLHVIQAAGKPPSRSQTKSIPISHLFLSCCCHWVCRCMTAEKRAHSQWNHAAQNQTG